MLFTPYAPVYLTVLVATFLPLFLTSLILVLSKKLSERPIQKYRSTFLIHSANFFCVVLLAHFCIRAEFQNTIGYPCAVALWLPAICAPIWAILISAAWWQNGFLWKRLRKQEDFNYLADQKDSLLINLVNSSSNPDGANENSGPSKKEARRASMFESKRSKNKSIDSDKTRTSLLQAATSITQLSELEPKPIGLDWILHLEGGFLFWQLPAMSVVQLLTLVYLPNLFGQCQGGWELLPMYAVLLLILVLSLPAAGIAVLADKHYNLRWNTIVGGFIAILIVPLAFFDVLQLPGLNVDFIIHFPFEFWIGMLYWLIHMITIIWPIISDLRSLKREEANERGLSSSPSIQFSEPMNREEPDMFAIYEEFTQNPHQNQAFKNWISSTAPHHYANQLFCDRLKRLQKAYFNRQNLGADIVLVLQELRDVYDIFFTSGHYVLSMASTTRQAIYDQFESGKFTTDVFNQAEIEIKQVLVDEAFSVFWEITEEGSNWQRWLSSPTTQAPRFSPSSLPQPGDNMLYGSPRQANTGNTGFKTKWLRIPTKEPTFESKPITPT